MSAFRSPSLALAIALSAPTALAQELPQGEIDGDLPDLSTLPAPLPESETSPVPAASGGGSQKVMLHLINRMVKRGLLTDEDAQDLLQLAQADAAAEEARHEEIRALVQDSMAPPADEGDVDVNYIPENVKAQMRDEITAEILAQGGGKGWQADTRTPEWVTKLTLFGDIRTRYDGTYFGDGNSNNFVNFHAVNTGSPFNLDGSQFLPRLNTTEDRDRIRLRARGGAGIALEEGFSAGFSAATGDSNSPVSTNQTMGGGTGNFSKYELWLDRAFLAYEYAERPEYDFTITLGRFDNPFFSSEVMWDDDIGLDGIAAKATFEVTDGVRGFITAAAAPVFNTAFNISSAQTGLTAESTDKWLIAGQAGIDWKINDDFSAKFAVGYYHFDGVQGRQSDPYIPLSSQDSGSTDGTRPAFAQKGNTYIPLRRITPDASNGFGTLYQYQYFGLATEFQNLTLTGRLDYDGYEPVRISVLGEVIKNVAYERNPLAQNNIVNGRTDGGDTAFFLNFLVGSPSFDKRGDWNVGLGYRYVESDAVIDGFTDSDFGAGGTNLKGFTLGGQYALSPSVRLGARWMSAQEIIGPELRSDIIQFDVNAKF